MTLHNLTPYELEPAPALTPEQLAQFEVRQGQWENRLRVLTDCDESPTPAEIETAYLFCWSAWERFDGIPYRALDPLPASDSWVSDRITQALFGQGGR